MAFRDKGRLADILLRNDEESTKTVVGSETPASVM